MHSASWHGSTVAVKAFSPEVPWPAISREVSIALSVEHPNLVLSLAVVKSPPCLVMEYLPLQDLCHGFHYPNELLSSRRLALKATQNALDRSRAEIMQNFAERGEQELAELHSCYLELEQRQAALREVTTECDRQLSLRLRVLILLDVATAVSILHDCTPPILHNDIRSPNIFLVSLDPQAAVRAKLGDFGLAQRLYGPCRLRLLTWQWLAPEVLRGDDFGLPSDVFSLGVVAWELLHGPGSVVPYEADQDIPEREIRDRICSQHLRPGIGRPVQSTFETDPLYPGLIQIMSSCWRADPNSRPTANAVAASLRQLLDFGTGGNNFRLTDSPTDETEPDFGEELYPVSDFVGELPVATEFDPLTPPTPAAAIDAPKAELGPQTEKEEMNDKLNQEETAKEKPAALPLVTANCSPKVEPRNTSVPSTPLPSKPDLVQTSPEPTNTTTEVPQASVLKTPLEPLADLLLATILSSRPVPALLTPWRQLLAALTAAAALNPASMHSVMLRVLAARQVLVTPAQYASYAAVLGEFEVVMAVVESSPLLDSVDACLLAAGPATGVKPTSQRLDPNLVALVAALSALVTVVVSLPTTP